MNSKGNQTYLCVMMTIAIFIGYQILKSLTGISSKDSVPPTIISDLIPIRKSTCQLQFEDFNKDKSKVVDKRYNDTNFVDGLINQQEIVLCKLNLINHCKGIQVVELLSDFWIIAPIYAYYQDLQPVLYEAHLGFKYYMESLGMPFCTFEAIRPDKGQKYLVSKPNNEPYDFQYEMTEEYYMRENFLNIAAKKIGNWSYLAWIDAHQIFENIYWWEESIVAMEKYASVQLFQRVIRLDVRNRTDFFFYGAIYKSVVQTDLDIGIRYYHGNAFAIRKEDYDSIGYILDECIASCCDCLYVYASFLGNISLKSQKTWTRYFDVFSDWVENTQKVFQGRRKAIRGDLIHIEHESFFSYMEALDLFNGLDFNVDRDLKRDKNMTLVLVNEDLRSLIHSIQSVPKLIRKITYGSVILILIVAAIFIYRRSKKPRYQHLD